MSYSTTCDFFLLDIKDNVQKYFTPVSKCDSTYTKCSLPVTDGSAFKATCDAKVHDIGGTNVDAYQYFCSCNGKQYTIPSGVGCNSLCYPDLTTQFNQCNVMALYDGASTGSPSIAQLGDTCEAYRCDSEGKICVSASTPISNTDGVPVFTCDNTEYDSWGSATHSYVCNCHGPAVIPEIYRNTDGKTQGTGCGNSGSDSGSGSGSASASSLASIGGATTTTVAPTGASTTASTNPTSTPAKSGQAKVTASFTKLLLLGLTASLFVRL